MGGTKEDNIMTGALAAIIASTGAMAQLSSDKATLGKSIVFIYKNNNELETNLINGLSQIGFINPSVSLTEDSCQIKSSNFRKVDTYKIKSQHFNKESYLIINILNNNGDLISDNYALARAILGIYGNDYSK